MLRSWVGIRVPFLRKVSGLTFDHGPTSNPSPTFGQDDITDDLDSNSGPTLTPGPTFIQECITNTAGRNSDVIFEKRLWSHLWSRSHFCSRGYY